MRRPVFRTFDGPQAYAPTIEAMAAHAADIRAGSAGEQVWLLEHAPVLTGGTSAQDSDLVNIGGIDVHRSGRGGQWTWHGPGQRVAYVMLDLAARNPDVRAYVQALEAWIIDTLASFRRERPAPGRTIPVSGWQVMASWTRLPPLACGSAAGSAGTASPSILTPI
jgi:lipoyl(octanoyl) transferase